MSIIITIVSNITVLVSHSIIFFGFFMPMSDGVKKKTPSSASPHLHHPLPGFRQACLLIYKKYFINHLLL